MLNINSSPVAVMEDFRRAIMLKRDIFYLPEMAKNRKVLEEISHAEVANSHVYDFGNILDHGGAPSPITKVVKIDD